MRLCEITGGASLQRRAASGVRLGVFILHVARAGASTQGPPLGLCWQVPEAPTALSPLPQQPGRLFSCLVLMRRELKGCAEHLPQPHTSVPACDELGLCTSLKTNQLTVNEEMINSRVTLPLWFRLCSAAAPLPYLDTASISVHLPQGQGCP